MDEKKGVTVQLALQVSGGRIVAELEFRNEGAGEVFLDRHNACLGGKIENNVFRISDGQAEVSYSGPYVKRRLGPEDFETLGPGKSISTKVRLEEAYRFPPGRHAYKAVYTALHQHPREPGFWEVASNEVAFSAW